MEPYTIIQPEDLAWRPSNLMKIPNADFLERTGSEVLGARMWKLPPGSAMTLHKHQEEDLSVFYPEDPKQLPPELDGVPWPPNDQDQAGPEGSGQA